MRIALTGATGFLGHALARHLLDAGHEVVAWYRSQPAGELGHDALTWVRGELGRWEDAVRLVEGCQAVVHAGVYRPGPSFLDDGDDPLDYWQRNATGSLMLLQAAHRAGAERFVFISSGAVHDHVLPDRPLDERHPLRPGTLYGAYKASVETLVHHFGVSGKLITAALRPTSIYGVAPKVEESKWYELVREVAAGNKVHAAGGSKAVHVDDVAKAALLLLGQDDSISGQAFNCCERMISDHEVATLTRQLAGSEAAIEGQPKQAKHQIETGRLEALGMSFGGQPQLEATLRRLLEA
jgi:dTDP-glucose 4,6-dehydratase